MVDLHSDKWVEICGSEVGEVKDVYASWDIQNRMKDGNMTYPKVGDEPETNSGMELEFRYALLLGYTILNQFLPQ